MTKYVTPESLNEIQKKIKREMLDKMSSIVEETSEISGGAIEDIGCEINDNAQIIEAQRDRLNDLENFQDEFENNLIMIDSNIRNMRFFTFFSFLLNIIMFIIIVIGGLF